MGKDYEIEYTVISKKNEDGTINQDIKISGNLVNIPKEYSRLIEQKDEWLQQRLRGHRGALQIIKKTVSLEDKFSMKITVS